MYKINYLLFFSIFFLLQQLFYYISSTILVVTIPVKCPKLLNNKKIKGASCHMMIIVIKICFSCD